eukprot:382774_1
MHIFLISNIKVRKCTWCLDVDILEDVQSVKEKNSVDPKSATIAPKTRDKLLMCFLLTKTKQTQFSETEFCSNSNNNISLGSCVEHEIEVERTKKATSTT